MARYIIAALVLFAAVLTSNNSADSREDVTCRFGFDGMFVSFHEKTTIEEVMSGKVFPSDPIYQVVGAFKNYNPKTGEERFLIHFRYNGVDCLGLADKLNGLPNIKYARPNRLG